MNSTQNQNTQKKFTRLIAKNKLQRNDFTSNFDLKNKNFKARCIINTNSTKNIKNSSISNTKLPNYSNTKLPNYSNTKLPNYSNTKLPNYNNVPTYTTNLYNTPSKNQELLLKQTEDESIQVNLFTAQEFKDISAAQLEDIVKEIFEKLIIFLKQRVDESVYVNFLNKFHL